MKPVTQVKVGMIAIIAVVVISVGLGLLGKNDDTKFTVKQPLHPVFGELAVIDRGGYYFKGMATVWEWNKFEDFYFSREESEGGSEDQSIRITFNDGGQADVSSYVRIQLPMEAEKRIEFNRQFSGNRDNIKSAIRSHLINCLKNTAPMMQSSEHQSARKTEFDQTVRDQLDNGLYSMAKEAVKQKDDTDENGQEITVYVTNLVLDANEQPVIAKESPIAQYGIVITQFSITGVEYDPKTRELFAAKKESSLAAEQSKAERIQETQQRLMVEEKGLREKAEIEAVANVEKAEAVIKAEKEKEMAEIAAQLKVAVEEQAKLEAEISKAKELAIEQADKVIAETAAEKQLEVKAILTLAEAEEEKIFRAGAITERERVLAEIAKERDIGIAEYLASIRVPQVTIGGNAGAEGAGATDNTTHLINLKLLEGAGLLDKSPISDIPPLKKAKKSIRPVAIPTVK
jgi:regulator of protease activity HflC (stomatin/prohibitin superfamily)